jgi:O-antigen/teichoic acid export membrane protein
MGIQPFYRAYFPRFAELLALGDLQGLRREYFQGCRMVGAIIVPAALLGWAFAPHLFTAWLGKADPTVVAIFRALLLGISCAGLMWLPAAFQQAHGWTRLHAAMIGGALAVGAPALFWTTARWGTRGATAVWVLHGVSDVTLGLWLMHRRLLPHQLGAWYRGVIAVPLLCSAPLVALGWWLVPAPARSLAAIASVGVVGVVVMFATVYVAVLRPFSDVRSVR